MEFSIDTHPWWLLLLFPFIAFCFSAASITIYHHTHKPTQERQHIAKAVSIEFMHIGALVLVLGTGAFSYQSTPSTLAPWSPTELTVNAAEVTLSPSTINPDMLCYVSEGQDRCLERPIVPAHFNLNEPVLVLSFNDTNDTTIVTTADASDGDLELLITQALGLKDYHCALVQLVER